MEQATLSLARGGAPDDRMLAVDIRRADIESALESAGGSSNVELLLDIAARGVDGGATERHTLTVGCAAADLERMLEGDSDTVRLGFDADAVARAIREPDIEAHGLREKMAVLAVVVATTGAVVGSAQAMPAHVQSGGTGTAVTDVRDMPADSMIASQAVGSHVGQMASPGIIESARAAQPGAGLDVRDMAADTLAATAATQSGAPIHDSAADSLAASSAAGADATVRDTPADSLAASSGPAAAPVRDFPGDVARSVATGDAPVVARDFPGEAARNVNAGQPVFADSSKAPPVTSTQGGSGVDLPSIDGAPFVVVGGIALALVGAAFAAASTGRRTPKPS